MIYNLVYSKAFRKSLKRVKRSEAFDLEKLEMIASYLCSGNTLPAQFKDHELKGDYSNCRECHIKNDLLLIYRINEILNVVTLVDIGSHSDLFG